MSLHIFYFDPADYPTEKEQLSRVENALRDFTISKSSEIQQIAYCLFIEKKDVTVRYRRRIITEIITSHSQSRYDLGYLVIERG